MSVIGIDFGDLNSFVAVARQGGIEIVTNDYSLRPTPSCVAFAPKNRILGVAAKNQQGLNHKNTVSNFKSFVGRQFSDPVVQCRANAIPYKISKTSGGAAAVEVQMSEKKETFSMDQVTGMLMSKLRDSAQKYINAGIVDCVVGVPCFWTDAQRRALLTAAKLSGLNVLRLINETTAVALNYGIYKQDLPDAKEKPRLVVFIDVGHSATQASVCQLHKGQLKMLAVVFDPNLGGGELTNVLRQHFAAEFKEKYRVDAASSPRAWLRLFDECEKLKKQMSANSTDIPINIECFMDDKDVSGKLKREQFEEMAGNFWQRMETLLQSLLKQAKIAPADIHACEIVGGSSRVPRIKSIIQSVFGKEPSTTLNQDEAVAKGCALQGAILSPAFRVRDFSLADIQPYSIKLSWSAEKSEDGEWEAFAEGHQFPFSKLLTFYRSEPFVLEASYSHPNHIPFPSTFIGRYRISNVTPMPGGESRKVKAKIRINPNGLFSVNSAHMYEPKEEEDMPPAAPEEPKEGEEQPTENGDNAAAAAEEKDDAGDKDEKDDAMEDDENPKDKKKDGKVKMRSVDLPIETDQPGLSTSEFNALKDIEDRLARQDAEVKAQADAKNAVEEYVYEMRDKLSDQLTGFIAERDADHFRSVLEDTENWLYDEGDDLAKQVYLDKMSELHRLGDPVVERYQEAQGRPSAFEQLAQSIMRARKVLDAAEANDPAYDHLTQTDLDTVAKWVQDKQGWFDTNMNKQQNRPLTDPPVVTVNEIYDQKKAFDSIVNPIITKAKPKPKVEEPKEDKKGSKEAPVDVDEPPADDQPPAEEATMDVD